MNFRFLGTGGAFDVEYGNSAALVEFKGKNLLLDCGFTVYPLLLQHQQISNLDYILLTHLHNDHSGSLANLLLHCHFFCKDRKLVILYPDDDFRLDIYEFLRLQVQTPEKYVEFMPISELPGLTAVDTFGQHSENYQTYAYIFEENGQRMVYSGDLGQPEMLLAHLKGLPPKPTTVFHDIAFSEKNIAHTYYKKLLAYPADYKVYGYHCDPIQSPKDNSIPLVYHQPELHFLPSLEFQLQF